MIEEEGVHEAGTPVIWTDDTQPAEEASPALEPTSPAPAFEPTSPADGNVETTSPAVEDAEESSRLRDRTATPQPRRSNPGLPRSVTLQDGTMASPCVFLQPEASAATLDLSTMLPQPRTGKAIRGTSPANVTSNFETSTTTVV